MYVQDAYGNTNTLHITVPAQPIPTYAVAVNQSFAASTGAGSYEAGQTVTIHAGSRDGYTFAGWSSADGITLANPAAETTTFVMPSHAVTVTADWKAVEEDNSQGGGAHHPDADVDNDRDDADDQNDDTQHIPDEDVPLTEQSTSFADVTASSWYHDAVDYVTTHELMNGISATTFGPDLTTTRGMIVTILYRLEHEPSVTGTTSFADVTADQYYANAVAWAAQNGIVSGISQTTFAPNAAITREQMAAILYRYAQYKGYDVTAHADLSVYTDAVQVDAYAADAMAWANGTGLVTGTGTSTLSPLGNASRAQVAAILMRFCETVAQ